MNNRNKQESNLLDVIVDRQFAVRKDEYDGVLRRILNGRGKDESLYTDSIANFYYYCTYARTNKGWVSFYKELDFLENSFIIEQSFYGVCFKLYRDCEFVDFEIPVFSIYPLLREAALNLVTSNLMAKMWLTANKVGEKVIIVVRHDVPEECLRNAAFVASNNYGFSLLRSYMEQCGGQLRRDATENGLMKNTFTVPIVAIESTEPVFLWYR